jgi:hypothetical protein
MREFLYPLLVFAVALSLRLYPTLVSGVPFSTDSWPPIRNTELLIERTPIDLGNRGVFDGYNNYWPFNSIFGAVFSQVISVEPRFAMAIVFPFIGAVAVLMFYTLVKGLFNAETSFIASTFFATGFTHALFTAAVTKETYGNPLYLLLILLFLKSGGVKELLLFSLASVALAFTHHLTPAITMLVLFSMALARLVSDFKKGLALNKFNFLHVGILVSATLLYYLLYAKAGFDIRLTPSDMLSVTSFQLVAFITGLFFASRKPSPIYCSLAAAVSFLLIAIATRTSIAPGAPVLPARYMLYAAPYIMASPFVGVGVGGASFAVFWLAAVLGVEGYAVFGNSDYGAGLAYRGLNFLLPPMALLCAVGLHRLRSTAGKLYGGMVAGRLVKTAVAVTVAAIALLNISNVYAAVSLQERYMGYFWLYTQPEYDAGLWLSNVGGDQPIAGDVKVSYLLKDYFDIEVEVLQGLRYLSGEDVPRPHLIYIYGQMLMNGYVLGGGYSVDLPQSWTEKLHSLNKLYSNGYVNIHGEQT